MGTWNLPQTKEKAAALEKLMEKEIIAAHAIHGGALSNLLGDDDLYDAIDKCGLGEDIRHQVVLTLERLISEPDETFTKTWEPGAREIWQRIIDRFWSEIENLENYPDSEEVAEKNFHDFVDGLEKLSRKYGVILGVTGGVHITNTRNPYLKRFCYTRDHTSGDLDSIGFFAE